MKCIIFFLLILSGPFSFAGKPLTAKEKAYHVLKGTAHRELYFHIVRTAHQLLVERKVGTPGEIEKIDWGWSSIPMYLSFFLTSNECFINGLNSFYQAASSTKRWVSIFNNVPPGESPSYEDTAFCLSYIPLVLWKTPIIANRLKDMALSAEGISRNKAKICLYSTILGSMLWSSKMAVDNIILNYRKAKAQRAKKLA